MRCILCKANSETSNSVEHIVPESLGNIEYILPPGWVCDGCNNYLSRKVEKPFLESFFGRNSRFEMRIPNKKGRIPSALGFHAQSQTKVELSYSDDQELCVGVAEGQDESKWVAAVLANKSGSLYLPTPDFPNEDYVTSRFIAKVAFEALAHRCHNIPSWNEELVSKPELDELRRYIRFGTPNSTWPVHTRRIYPKDFCFTNVEHGEHQVLHEWDIVYTPEGDLYVVIAILGVEFTINLGGRELEGYQNWLKSNNDRSPLYDESETIHSPLMSPSSLHEFSRITYIS